MSKVGATTSLGSLAKSVDRRPSTPAPLPPHLPGRALPVRRSRSRNAAVRCDRGRLGVQAESERLAWPLRVVGQPGMDRGAAGIEVVDRAIDTEDEPAAVGEPELMSLVSTASADRRPRGPLSDGFVIHRGHLSRASHRNGRSTRRKPPAGRSGRSPRGIAVDARCGGHAYPSPPGQGGVPRRQGHRRAEGQAWTARRVAIALRAARGTRSTERLPGKPVLGLGEAPRSAQRPRGHGRGDGPLRSEPSGAKV